MMVGDPVRSGLVANFARPGGNITGYTVLGPEIAAKRLHPLFSGIQKTRPMPPMNGSISKARAAPEGRGFSCAPQAASCALSQSPPRFLRLRPHRAERRRPAARSARGPQGHACIIDGEAVACDDNGVASFDRIRYRRHDGDAFLYAFDLIELNGDDMRRDPLEVRKATLRSMLAKAGLGPALQRAYRRRRPDHLRPRLPDGTRPCCAGGGHQYRRARRLAQFATAGSVVSLVERAPSLSGPILPSRSRGRGSRRVALNGHTELPKIILGYKVHRWNRGCQIASSNRCQEF